MPRVSHYYFRSGILFLIIGIAIGISMSMTQVHNVVGAHAHINLLGWVTSAVFGGYFALNPARAGRLALIQYVVYTVGVAVMCGSLYLLLQGNEAMTPIVAVSSLVTFVGVLLFAWIVWAPGQVGSRHIPQPAE